MNFLSIPTLEEARENKVARLLWAASKTMIIYQGQRGFASKDLFGDETEVPDKNAFIENVKMLGFEVLKERDDFSGFDKI